MQSKVINTKEKCMLICFYGSGELKEELLKSIIDAEGADKLLVLPGDEIFDKVVPLFKKENKDYSLLAVLSWRLQIEEAVLLLKEVEGFMVLYPGNSKTLSAAEEYIADRCMLEKVRFEII